MDFIEFQKVAGEWAERTFPKSTTASVLAHMEEEMFELKLAEKFHEQAEEVADILLLLIHYCHKNNINLFGAAKVKFKENQSRKWATEANEKGYFKHEEE